jgi:lipopolysaccharide transport system permease protein
MVRDLSVNAGITRGIGGLIAPTANLQALSEGVRSLWHQRSLCIELARRDLGAQFAGQVLGAFWIIGHPLLLFGVYVFIFAVVMKVRIATSLDMPRDYSTYILAGLIPWLSVQQSLTRSAGALIAQAGLVKQVVFPIEVLPLGAVLISFVPLAVGLLIVALQTLASQGGLPWTYVLLPLVLCCHLFLMTGFAFVLSGLTPFFRDIKDIILVLTVVGVYVIPAFYLPQWVPEILRGFLYANPFSYVIWVYQDVLYFGAINHPSAWLIFIGGSGAAFSIGFRAFRLVRPYIANVL